MPTKSESTVLTHGLDSFDELIDEVVAHFFTGSVRLALNRLIEAQEEIEEGSISLEQRGKIYFYTGLGYHFLGKRSEGSQKKAQVEKATGFYLKAMNFLDEDAEVANNLAEAYEILERPFEAEYYFRLALKSGGSHASLYRRNYGEFLINENNPGAAADVLFEAIHEEPSDRSAHELIIKALRSAEDGGKAEEYAQLLLDLEQNELALDSVTRLLNESITLRGGGSAIFVLGVQGLANNLAASQQGSCAGGPASWNVGSLLEGEKCGNFCPGLSGLSTVLAGGRMDLEQMAWWTENAKRLSGVRALLRSLASRAQKCGDDATARHFLIASIDLAPSIYDREALYLLMESLADRGYFEQLARLIERIERRMDEGSREFSPTDRFSFHRDAGLAVCKGKKSGYESLCRRHLDFSIATLSLPSDYFDETLGQLSLAFAEDLKNMGEYARADLVTKRNFSELIRLGRIREGAELAFSMSESIDVVTSEPRVGTSNFRTGRTLIGDSLDSILGVRSSDDYLQLVPGIQSAAVNHSSGAATPGRSDLSYNEVGGEIGTPRGEIYFFEGTELLGGRRIADLIDPSAIQETSTAIGGLAPEFAGESGTVSNLITVSGSNSFSGRFHHFNRDDSFAGSNKNEPESKLSAAESSLAFGGPIHRDRAWFFLALRHAKWDQRLTASFMDPRRDVLAKDVQLTTNFQYTPTQSGLVGGKFFGSDYSTDGSFDRDQVVNRNSRLAIDTTVGTLTYSHVFNSLVLELAFSMSLSDSTALPVFSDPRNDVLYRFGEVPDDLVFSQLGGAGESTLERGEIGTTRGSLEYLADTIWGSHTIKFGLDNRTFEEKNSTQYLGNSQYSSIAASYQPSGISARQVALTFNGSRFSPFRPRDFRGLISSINSHDRRDALYQLLDTNRDGVINVAEMADGLVFDSTKGNPDRQINYSRSIEAEAGLQVAETHGLSLYLQETWQYNKWSVNVGIRGEAWEILDSLGQEIGKFELSYSPRFSLVWDAKGDGKNRLSFYAGRYRYPIRNGLGEYAAYFSDRVVHEQVFVDGDWLTYNTFGGESATASFSSDLQTPYTDEFQIAYRADFRENLGFEVNVFRRRSRQVLEDYDSLLYSDVDIYRLPVDHPESLFFGDGLSETDSEGREVLITNLFGGKRDVLGLDLVFRKRYGGSTRFLATYTFLDIEGNTNSFNSSSLQGDVLWYDPRAINRFGRQTGSVRHQLNFFGVWQLPERPLSIYGRFRWNSGAVLDRAFLVTGRHLPVLDINDPEYSGEPIQFAGGSGLGEVGGSGFWIAPNAVSALDGSSFGRVDISLAYTIELPKGFEADLLLNVFNLLNTQDGIRRQDLVSGGEGVKFGGDLEFAEPIRFYLGARLRFNQ